MLIRIAKMIQRLDARWVEIENTKPSVGGRTHVVFCLQRMGQDEKYVHGCRLPGEQIAADIDCIVETLQRDEYLSATEAVACLMRLAGKRALDRYKRAPGVAALQVEDTQSEARVRMRRLLGEHGFVEATRGSQIAGQVMVFRLRK